MDIIIYLFVFLPIFLSAILLSPIMPDEERGIRNITKGFTYIILALAVILSLFFDFSQPDYCLETGYDWMNTLGINVSFMADSLGVIFCVLSSFIFALVIHISKGIKPPFNLYYALIMVLQTSVNGMLLSKDMFLYFSFAALGLIPVFILTGKWGSANREKTAIKYFLYRLTGLAFILIGFLLIYLINFKYNGILSSDLNDIDVVSMPDNIRNIIIISLLTGFFINMAVVPFHRWLVNTLTDSPAGLSIITAVSLNIAFSFGFIRYVYCIFEYEMFQNALWISALSAITIIYSLLCVLRENNLKRIISYSLVTETGLFLSGLFSLNIIGITGGIISLILFTLLITGLYITEKHISNSCGTDNIMRISGLYHKMPGLSVIAFLLFTIIPVMMGFAAMLLCINGSFLADNTDGVFIKLLVIISAAAIVLYAAKLIYVYCGMFTGNNMQNRKISDIKIKQLLLLSIITAIIIFIFVFMTVFADVTEMYIYDFLNQAELFNGIN